MERDELVLGLGELAVRFSEGWHEGIKIDALDIVLLNEAAEALAQPALEPVAWATKEDFYRELDRRVERMRKEMEIKTVTMRCKDYDVALNIVDMYGGHVVVGQVSFPSQRTWVGLTEKDFSAINQSCLTKLQAATSAESILKEKNT